MRFIEWDKELFIYLNSKHSEFLDPIMLTLSSINSWFIIWGIIVAAMIYKSHSGRLRLIAPLLMLATTGVNNLLNHFVKITIQRERPIHIEAWEGFIHALEEYESSYSFFSAHSSNAFCLAVFSLLYFRNKCYTAAILIWATATAYSRIYLAKHFPLDVMCGILFGTMMGIIGYKLYCYLIRRYDAKQVIFNRSTTR